MSTISLFQPLTCSIHHTNTSKPHSFVTVNFQKTPIYTQKFTHLNLTHKCKRVRSSEGEAGISEVVAEEEVAEAVAVPISPADKLIMFFQAEGTMNEAIIPTVTKALEGTEGISDLKVLVSEGIASVELTKQTTIQATGVASGLLETIQGAGFRLNTLNLSFEDEELLTV